MVALHFKTDFVDAIGQEPHHPARALRARTPDPAWPQRAVGEGVMFCPRAGWVMWRQHLCGVRLFGLLLAPRTRFRTPHNSYVRGQEIKY